MPSSSRTDTYSPEAFVGEMMSGFIFSDASHVVVKAPGSARAMHEMAELILFGRYRTMRQASRWVFQTSASIRDAVSSGATMI